MMRGVTDPFLPIAVGVVIAVVIGISRVQSSLTRRVRRAHPDAFFVERADLEDGQTRHRPGYLIVEDLRLGWVTMRGERQVTIDRTDQAMSLSIGRRGFVPDAGAELTVAMGDRRLRFLTFKYSELTRALRRAGFLPEL